MLKLLTIKTNRFFLTGFIAFMTLLTSAPVWAKCNTDWYGTEGLTDVLDCYRGLVSQRKTSEIDSYLGGILRSVHATYNKDYRQGDQAVESLKPIFRYNGLARKLLDGARELYAARDNIILLYNDTVRTSKSDVEKWQELLEESEEMYEAADSHYQSLTDKIIKELPLDYELDWDIWTIDPPLDLDGEPMSITVHELYQNMEYINSLYCIILEKLDEDLPSECAEASNHSQLANQLRNKHLDRYAYIYTPMSAGAKDTLAKFDELARKYMQLIEDGEEGKAQELRELVARMTMHQDEMNKERLRRARRQARIEGRDEYDNRRKGDYKPTGFDALMKKYRALVRAGKSDSQEAKRLAARISILRDRYKRPSR